MELDKLLLDLDVRKDGIVAKPSFEDVGFEGRDHRFRSNN